MIEYFSGTALQFGSMGMSLRSECQKKSFLLVDFPKIRIAASPIHHSCEMIVVRTVTLHRNLLSKGVNICELYIQI